MCGFAGYIDTSCASTPGELESVAEAMANTLAHRGPDAAGVWTDAEAGVALGHRRLAVIDLSQNGHQPMTSHCGRYVIIYNGEIYNFRRLAEELENGGHHSSWRGHSDTEVLLAAISAWGVEGAMARLNGMFAFALWDRKRRSLFLARDRMGEKPLYYGWQGHCLVFASELKALRKHPQWAGTTNRSAVALQLEYSYIPAPYSIFENIHKLPQGTLLEVPFGGSTLRRSAAASPAFHPKPFWSLKDAAEAGVAVPMTASVEDIGTQFDHLLREAVALRMESDVPLGVFLSGGIDSSLVAALMQQQSPRPVKTFTIGFEADGFNEAQQAARVAAHLETDHTELYVTPEAALAVIPKLATIHDEPFSDPSAIPTFLLSELARRDVTVALSGDGGDELLCGYRRYDHAFSVWRKINRLPAPVRRLAGRLAGAGPNRASWLMLQALGPLWHKFSRTDDPDEALAKIARLFEGGDLATVYRMTVAHWKEPTKLVRGAEALPTVFSNGTVLAGANDPREYMMLIDCLSYLPDDILVKVDRTAMAVSLETRLPLLDHRLVEFCWSLPFSLKLRDGEAKWLLKQALYRHVPRAMVDRPKMGFGIPLDAWLRGVLKEWCEDLLYSRDLVDGAGLDPAPIHKMWLEHSGGVQNWGRYLWDVLTYLSWFEAQRTND